jgi:2-polyprenyl-3-methyl-5-hydroxy-6-metoxy-1,4-benzoquinol methylase
MASSMDRREYAHISFELTLMPYHTVVADLAVKYAGEDGRVLDFGCGVGHVLQRIAERGRGIEVTGADPSRKCLDITRERVGSAKTILLRDGELDVEQLGHGYDVCTLSQVLEHMLSPIETLAKVFEITKPGGHVVLAVPNPARPNVLFGNLFKRHYCNRGHVYAWDRSHWINFLEKILGLEVVEYASDFVWLIPSRLVARAWWLRRFEVAVARVLPWWSFSNIAVVRRPDGDLRDRFEA